MQLMAASFPRAWRSLARIAAIGCVASVAHADDFRSTFPPQFTETPLGVNIQTGKFRYWPYTFQMGPFVLERGFNRSDFPFLGIAYWHSVQTAGGNPMSLFAVKLGETRLDFSRNQDGTYLAWTAPTIGWLLQRSGAGHLLTDKSGNTFYFSDFGSAGSDFTPGGRATLATYADGSNIAITYDANNRVQWLQSNRGYGVRVEVLAGGAQVKMCGFNLAAVNADANTSCSASNYTVTTNNTALGDGTLRLDSYVDVAGKTSTVSYAGGQVQCITMPNSSTCEFTNTYGTLPGEVQHTKGDQVRVQTDALGRQYSYDYINPGADDPPRFPGGPPVISEALFSIPGSPVVNGAYPYFAHYENGLVTYLQAPGRGANQFTYNGVNLAFATWPEGNKLEITRDIIGNATTIVETPKPGSGQAALTSTQAFPLSVWSSTVICTAASAKLCDKPTAKVDARGNQSDYTYDPAHGGVLTATLPADSNGIRPQTRYEYTQRYAWVKNAAGGFVQATTPVWVKTRERMCRTTAAAGQSCAGGAADETITDYDYGPNNGPNNLLLRGVAVTANGQTLRTCYTYDTNGRKISETQPNAGLGSCP